MKNFLINCDSNIVA